MKPALRFLLVLLAAALPALAFSQPFPTKPIRLIIPFPAGGPADIFGRFLAQGMGAYLGQTIVIENVAGLMSSHGGRDFTTLVTEFADAGYRVGAMVIDAALFSPQSRQRLFIVAHKGKLPPSLVANEPDPAFHPATLRTAVETLSDTTHLAWVWWRLPLPPRALRPHCS